MDCAFYMYMNLKHYSNDGTTPTLKPKQVPELRKKNSISTNQSTQREYQTVTNQVYNRLVSSETKPYSFVTLEEVIYFFNYCFTDMLKYEVDIGDKEMQQPECCVLEEFPPNPEPKEHIMHVTTTKEHEVIDISSKHKEVMDVSRHVVAQEYCTDHEEKDPPIEPDQPQPDDKIPLQPGRATGTKKSKISTTIP